MDAAKTGEADDVENVLGGGGSADHVARERLRHIGALEFSDGAEGVEYLGGLGCKRGRKLVCRGS